MTAASQIIRHGGVSLYPLESSQLGVVARVIGSGRTMPMTAAEALRRGGARAVLDGTMFDICDSPAGATEAQRYAASQCSKPQYGCFDVGRSIDIPSQHPTRGLTIGSFGAASFVVDGYARPEGALVGIQLYPSLIRSGEVVASNTHGNATEEWRAAVVVLTDGRLGLATGAMDMVAFATVLREMGATDAGYTDGGGSTRLATDSGEHAGASENRRVAIWIAAMPAAASLAAMGAAVGVLGTIGAGLFRWFTGSWPWD